MTPRRRSRSSNDSGMVTVEAAISVFALALVLSLGAAAIMAVVGQLRCTDAAREVARLVARGEPERADAVVQAIAPAGAHLTVRTDGDTVQVEVSADAGNLLPGLHLTARAYAVLEPTSDG